VSSKPDLHTISATDPAPPAKSSNSRHHSKDSVASFNTAFISRQRIDPKTEHELRAACALILQDFKPSDHDIADADPKLDFRLPHRRREYHPETSQAKAHRPVGASEESRSSHGARKQSHKANSASKGYPDLPAQANTGRRRVDAMDCHADRESDVKRPGKSPMTDLSKHPFTRTETDSDDAKSLSTPLTASTDAHLHNYSTAPTSVAVTNRSSKRTSRQSENPAAVADAQAAEWMRQELEKRRQQMASHAQNLQQHHQPPPERPLSRSASIKSGIKEYIFPGSRNLSRSQSRDSLRSQSSSQSRPSGSSHGWRSWGLHRLSSSRNSSRPSTSNGRSDRQEADKKGDLNLNRALPPLPSLDTWKDTEQRKEQSKSQLQGAHIATLMRTQDSHQRNYAAAVRQHRRSGSDSLATRYANAYPQNAALLASPTQQAFANKSTVLVPEHQSIEFDHGISMVSAQNLDDHHKFRLNGSVLQRSTSAVSRGSHDGRMLAPNFSRKISTDVPPTDRTFNCAELSYPNTVQIAATHAGKREEQKSKLKKVLSGWMLRKEKKEDWMQKLEKDGVKRGVMTQNDASLPVVRY